VSSIAFITLGCAKNLVDTDRMRARVLSAGHSLANDPAEAEVVVVNTCAFVTEATEEAIAVILEATALPRVASGEARLIVAGCLPSRYGTESLSADLAEVAAFVPVDDEERIVEIINGGTSVARFAPEVSSATTPDVAAARFAAEAPVLRTVSAPWAYLKIAEGCDRFCSFCTIPLIRGRYQSRSSHEICAEAAKFVRGGVRELVLIAQDTGRWSEPREQTPALAHASAPGNASLTGLADLLNTLASQFPETWIRVMYLQPSGVTDELLEVMAAHDNICDYLDIPLQHASARVLKEMNRSGSGAEYLELLARIRAALPKAVVRTTVIAGFPGETRAEARELERFIAAANFDYVGVFPYSPEEGTVAGERSDQIPKRTRLARAQRLRDLADNIGFALAAARVGSTAEVLITQREEDASELCPLLGRTQGQAPEVDGMVHLYEGCVGQRLSVRITESYCYELEGEVCDA
jgi:ribosomal protein S12 methylthiotransferase